MKERRSLLLEGLACTNCAAKIEEEVRRLDGVSSAELNFSAGILTLEAEAGAGGIDDVVRQAVEIIGRHEPDVIVTEKTSGAKAVGGNKAASGGAGIPLPKIICLGAGGALFLAAVLAPLPQPAVIGLCLAAWLLLGGDVLLRAVRNISRGKVFDENFLMAVATTGAFAIGQYPEAAAVMLFYKTGELLQSLAVDRSRRSIGALMDIRPDYANLKTGDAVRRVAPEEVKPGDIILVKPGEKVPLDGIVTEGQSALDVSALSGESLPRDVSAGEGILSGSVNLNGLLTIEVTKEFGQSTVSRILDLVQNAGSKKAPTEDFITKFAKVYTPAVVFSALALAVVPCLFVGFSAFPQWLHRALVFLVVSCPCALVISIPLGFFGGIGGASRRGILVKGGNCLEALGNVGTVVFDKTGTLTKGALQVVSILPVDGVAPERVLEDAAIAESASNHPIAVSIRKAYGGDVDCAGVERVTELPGYGMKAMACGREILAGNGKLMAMENIAFTPYDGPGTHIYVAAGGTYSGCIVLDDELKPDARRAVDELRALGVGRLVMLSGDAAGAAESIGRLLGLDEVHAELLPDRKVALLEELEKRPGGKLLFAGDGINDAPALARADIGVAMGGLGSDAAIEAADIVIMTDEPSKLAEAVRVARRTKVIVWQNIVFSLGVKGVFLALGAFGVATMWEAVFADVGVTLLAVLNAIRTMGKRL